MYTVAKLFLILSQVQLIRKKEFLATNLDSKDETSILYIASIIIDINVHLLYISQIAFLKANKTLTCMLFKYTKFAEIFFKDLVAELPKHTKINDHAIDLIKWHQLFYKSIYNLGPMKLETVKP